MGFQSVLIPAAVFAFFADSSSADTKDSAIKPPVKIAVHASLKTPSEKVAISIRRCISKNVGDTKISDGIRVYRVTKEGVSPLVGLGSLDYEIECIKSAMPPGQEGVVSVSVEGPHTQSSLGVQGASPAGPGRKDTEPAPFIYEMTKEEYGAMNTSPGPYGLLTQARVVPEFRDGKIVGYKIFSIVPGSLYQQLGLEDGDVLLEINGDPIDSPEKALRLFQALRTQKDFSIRLFRNGEMTFNYHLK